MEFLKESLEIKLKNQLIKHRRNIDELNSLTVIIAKKLIITTIIIILIIRIIKSSVKYFKWNFEFLEIVKLSYRSEIIASWWKYKASIIKMTIEWSTFVINHLKFLKHLIGIITSP